MDQSFTQTNSRSICFVHDWLVTMRGGEKVLESMVELFPEASIYTLFYKRQKLSPLLQTRKIYTSFLQYLPGIEHYYRFLLPLFQLAIRSINVLNYDVVISSSHCVAKAVKTKKNSVHICYCHTPMRYLWGFQESYFGNFPTFLRKLIELFFHFLKKWDIKTSQHVDYFIANSKNTAQKIKKIYNCESTVIHPPFDPIPSKIHPTKESGNYYLIVSALVQYKRIDLAIEAFNRSGKSLRIVGDGPLKEHLMKLVRSPEIKFEGWVDQEMLWKCYANCKALIFPGEEDFGIVPLEAQSFGKPVIAYGRGGVTESVIPANREPRSLSQCTGLFFDEPTEESLFECVQKSESLVFNEEFIRSHVTQFNKEHFQKKILNFLISKGVYFGSENQPSL